MVEEDIDLKMEYIKHIRLGSKISFMASGVLAEGVLQCKGGKRVRVRERNELVLRRHRVPRKVLAA